MTDDCTQYFVTICLASIPKSAILHCIYPRSFVVSSGSLSTIDRRCACTLAMFQRRIVSEAWRLARCRYMAAGLVDGVHPVGALCLRYHAPERFVSGVWAVSRSITAVVVGGVLISLFVYLSGLWGRHAVFGRGIFALTLILFLPWVAVSRYYSANWAGATAKPEVGWCWVKASVITSFPRLPCV